VEKIITQIAHQLFAIKTRMDILGPAPAPMERIRGNYHWRITVKSSKEKDPSGSKLRQLLRSTVMKMKEFPVSGNYRIIIDIDPGDML
jgi:primosomal protein N' (replication factor Y)